MKNLQLQLTVDVISMFNVFFGSLIPNWLPCTAVQMLWVNLIMDSLACKWASRRYDPPPSTTTSSEHITTQVIWTNILAHSIYQIVVSSLCVKKHFSYPTISSALARELLMVPALSPTEPIICTYSLLWAGDELEKHWTSKNALKWSAASFEKDLYVEYICKNLRAYFESGATKE